MSGRDCVRRWVEMGAQYVFVSEGVVYSIRNHDLVDLTTWAGQDVQLEGEVRHNVLTVSHGRPLTARRSAGPARVSFGYEKVPIIRRAYWRGGEIFRQ